MRHLLLLLSLPFAHLLAVDFTIAAADENGRPLEGVAIEATFSHINDPRSSSMRSFEGKSDQAGIFRFAAGKEMCLIRLRADKPGYHEADMDHRHGLGVIPSATIHTITLPSATGGIPLVFKDALLTAEKGELPPKTWVGFDFAVGDVVAPWGKGVSSDLLIWNEGVQVGWTESDDTIARFKKDTAFTNMSEARFADIYGSFRGLTRLKFKDKGAGIVRTTAFWPYSRLKMPPLAPPEGYVPELEIPYSTLPPPEEAAGHTGFFLRLRPTCDPAGKVTSARYAKIHGQIASGYGWVSFRFYYNPTANDRRLVFDLERNLLKPPSGTPGPELGRYQAYER